LHPNNAVTHNNLGVAFAALNRHQEAIANYTTALALNANYAEAHNNLAAVLLSINEAERALGHCEKAVALKPALAEAHNNLANAQKALNRYDRAIASYRTAIALKPDYAQGYANMGDALRELGLADDARHAYEKAVNLSPAKAQFHRRLAENSRLSADDSRLATVRKLAADASLPVKDQIEAHFALAKVLADLEQHAESFEHLLKGNALHRARIDYDEAATLDLFDRIRTVFTPELLQAKSGLGDPSALPVFIVGMIRSGTTLVEQILASHPDVHGAGELTDFAKASTVAAPNPSAEEFPESFATITGDGLKRLAATYLARIRALAPSAQRITDKMPANFRLLGAIHLALPNARIIHLRRDPVDTCLSCFSILFAGEQPYAYDLAELGRYYRAYDSLMQHWRRVLPSGVMLEITYEELTSNTELEARKIVAHCGLNWNDRCLAFHQTPRPVRTASALQVRRPIYRTSIGRRGPYENQLSPLLTVLR
jgi:Flp pilus assembly protein TadD